MRKTRTVAVLACLAAAGLALAEGASPQVASGFVFERAPAFSICPGCGRIYWPGTHFGDLDRKLSEILGRRGDPGSGASAAGRPAKKTL